MKRHDILKDVDLGVIGRGQESPRLVKSVALCESAQRENGLSSLRSPAHAATLHSLRDKRLAGRLDDAGAHRQILVAIARVAHAVAIFAEVAELGGDALAGR